MELPPVMWWESEYLNKDHIPADLSPPHTFLSMFVELPWQFPFGGTNSSVSVNIICLLQDTEHTPHFLKTHHPEPESFLC